MFLGMTKSLSGVEVVSVSVSICTVSCGNEMARISWLQFRFLEVRLRLAFSILLRRMAA